MPKVLFTDEYKDLSAEAKLLYGLTECERLMKQRISSSARIIFIKIRNIFVILIPIAL